MATVNAAQAKQIAACKEDQGHRVLAQILDLGPYGEERNLQNVVRVDFLYDHLMFAVNKGFSWEQVCRVVSFAQDFLGDSAEKSLTQMVKTYQAQSGQLLCELGERNYKIYTDFLFSTFLAHFQLYKFVLCNPRKESVPEINLDTYPPVPPLPLSVAKEKSIWSYERRVAELEKQEAELEEQRVNRKQQIEAESNVKRAAAQAHVNASQTPFTKESLGAMIREVLEEYASSASKAIVTDIQDARKELEVKLEKTALPRPPVLGPPPRFAPKSAIQPLPKPNVAPKASSKSTGKQDKVHSPKSGSRTPRVSSRVSSSRASRKH